jgi:hypothetical protein
MTVFNEGTGHDAAKLVNPAREHRDPLAAPFRLDRGAATEPICAAGQCPPELRFEKQGHVRKKQGVCGAPFPAGCPSHVASQLHPWYRQKRRSLGMKKHTLGVSLAAGFVLLLFAAPPSYADRAAQAADHEHQDHGSVGVAGVVWSAAPQATTVNVPFLFAVGDEVLPPGRYTVAVDSGDASVVRLVSADGRNTATVMTLFGARVDERTNARFAFKRYGPTDYVLSAVAIPGDSVRQIPVTKRELTDELAKLAMARYEARHRG